MMVLPTMGLMAVGIADNGAADNGVTRDEATNDGHRGLWVLQIMVCSIGNAANSNEE